MIRVVCEACGARFRAKEEYAGRRGKCPKCGDPVIVPHADEDDDTSDAGEEPAPARAPAPPPRRRPAARPAPSPVEEDIEEEPGEDLEDEAEEYAEETEEEYGEEEDGEDEADEEEAPVVVAFRGRRGGRRGRRRSPRTVPARTSLAAGARLAGVQRRRNATILWLVSIVLVFAVAIWLSLPYFTGQFDASPHFSDGQDALSRGRYEEAIEHLSKVPADSKSHAQAQDLLARARSERDQQQASLKAKQETKSWNWIVAYNDNQLGAYDDDPDFYSAYARYLLVRLRDYLEEFPDGAHAADARKMQEQLEDVASLASPPSELDVDVEVYWRLQAFQYGEAWRVVTDWASANPREVDVIEGWRRDVRNAAEDRWNTTRGELQRHGHLTEGAENWAAILSKTMGYLDLIEGVPGVGREAQALYDRARRRAEG